MPEQISLFDSSSDQTQGQRPGWAEALQAIDAGAVVYCSHSGGKDSQAMYAELREIVPADRLVIVHADLGEIEWTGVQAHIHATTAGPVNVVAAAKSFFDMVERRHASRPEVPPWPSASTRQCTSDLKRGPIHKFIRADMKARGALLAINATGIRAEESSARAKQAEWKLNKMLSKAGRTVHDWQPIHDWSEQQVFDRIRAADQVPFWAYKRNRRLSCVFCILGCASDLKHGAEQRPELFERYVELERRTGYTMFNGQSLAERIATEK